MRWCLVVCVLLTGLISCRYSTLTVQAPEVMQGSALDLPAIRRCLERAGFQPGPYNANDLTSLSHAIAHFQGFAQLPVTGVLDRRTWDLMQRLYDPGPVPGFAGPVSRLPVRPASIAIKPVGSLTVQHSAVPMQAESTGASAQGTWPPSVLTTVQTVLADLGYDMPATTGPLDAATQHALRQFQQAQQLPAQGGLTQDTLCALLEARCTRGCQMTVLVSAVEDAQIPQAPATHLALTGTDGESILVQGMQTMLTRQGYDTQGVDGNLGAATQEALRAFQRAAQVTEQGDFTGETALALLAASCEHGCDVAMTVLPQEQGQVEFLAAKAAKSKPKKLPPTQRPEPSPLQVNDVAYASEKVECSPISGDWVTLYQGSVIERDDTTIALRLEERFGYRHYPKQEGVNRTDWWCIPRRRHCYAPISFSDWGGTFSKTSVQRFPVERVYDARPGLINSMSNLLKQHCQR